MATQTESLCTSLCQPLDDCNADDAGALDSGACKDDCMRSLSDWFPPPIRADYVEAYRGCMSRKSCGEVEYFVAHDPPSGFWDDQACIQAARDAIAPAPAIRDACTSCCANAGDTANDCLAGCLDSTLVVPDSAAGCIQGGETNGYGYACGLDHSCASVTSFDSP